MKLIKYFILSICFSTTIMDSFLFSQTDNGGSLLIKYWHYRNRLRYFVVNNENSSTSEKGIANVSGIRNCNNISWEYLSPDYISYGQQLSYMGYYIGVLATEYKLLSDAGISNEAQLTLNELYRALLSVKRLDMCESGYPWGVAYGGTHTTDQWDGYLNRNDVPWNFLGNPTHSNELNEGLDPLNLDPTSNPGYPTYVNKIFSSDPNCENILLMNNDASTDNNWDFLEQGQVSRDELSKLFIGLALVKRCIPSFETDIHTLNSHISKLIYNHIASHGFWIKNPDNNVTDPIYPGLDGGADCNDLGWGLYGTVVYIRGNSDLIPPPMATYLNWNNFQIYDFINDNDHKGPGIDHITCSFAAIADNWVNPYLLLFPGIIVPSTGDAISNICSPYNWETFYLTLWKFLNNKTEHSDIENKVHDQLIAAPCQGPYYFNDNLHSENGWASSFKYQLKNDKQNDGQGNDFGGNYTGLDYMLMHNLYLLEFGNTFYTDLINREVTGTNPTMFINSGATGGTVYINKETDAFKTLTSTQTISNMVDVYEEPPWPWLPPINYLGSQPWTGCVTYTAEKMIHLKPGFNVQPGATFHGYIRKQLCDLTTAPITTTSPYITELWDKGGYIQKNTMIAEQNQNKSLQIENILTDSINQDFNIFPNPFKDCFYFTNSTNENVNFEILDVSLKIISSGKLNYENCFRELPSGIYMLKIYFIQNVKVLKMIKS